ncbi:MAG TPA: hypothetical protein VMF61_04155, partial [Candidatus Acidoferrales bacterium]|nr:hypothetical protein [Candidatus Acidoferrales bacterium]
MRKRVAFGLPAAAVVIGLVIAGRHEVVRFAIQTGASLASGYDVRIADQRIGPRQAALYGVHVSHAGQPLLDAARIDVRYSLRDLLPGSTHRFGLVAISIDSARLTVVKFRDGSYNFAVPSAGAPAAPPAPVPVNSVPIRFTLRMHDAALVLREPNAYDVSAENVGVRDFDVDASIDTAGVTHYEAKGSFREDRDEPFTIAGTIDAVRGYAMHRARARRFPLRALANYFADTPVVRILRGRARNFDARLYSLDVRPNVPASYHVSLQLDVEGGRMALSALDEPIDGIFGRLQVVDNVFFLHRIDATLAGIPLRVTGGIFDLTGALTGMAQLRLGVYGSGDLRALRKAFTFTKDQPVSGIMNLGVLVEGPIDNPLIVADGRAGRTVYRGLPFDRLHAGIVYHDNLVALAPLRANYGGIDAAVRGSLAIGKHLHSEIALHVAGTSDRLPYLDEMLRGEPMIFDAAATGNDFDFHVDGAGASARGVDRVAAIFRLEPNGTAAVAPFWARANGGSFEGGYFLDRPHGDSGFWAVASQLRMRAPGGRPFPGLTLPEMPPVDARSIDAAVMGGGSATHVDLAGRIGGSSTEIAGVRFDRVDAAFSGTMNDAAVNALTARGPWGAFSGAGAFSSQAFVARGAYSGTFEGLQPFLGSAIVGHGALAGTAAIAVEPNQILVQGERLTMRHATLHGIPIREASLTLGVEPKRLRVYSAHATAAGGDVVAAGTFATTASPAPGDGGRLSLVAGKLHAADLKSIGLPLEAGQLWASGNLAAGAPIPAFEGGVTVAGGVMQHYPLSGSGDVRVAGDAAHLSRMIGALGPTYAYVRGSIGSLASGTPSYAIDADAPAGSVAGALHALGYPNYMTQGSFNARLHLGGRGAEPSVEGSIGVPAGNVNGLPFLDASAHLRADPRGASVRHGSVLIGSTRAFFGAGAFTGANYVHVVASHADLEDFDNFFDTGDTLAGTGSVRAAAATNLRRFTSSGDVDVAGFRYRNLPIGNTRASWTSDRDVVHGSIAAGSARGSVKASGSIDVAPRASLIASLFDSRYDLSGTAGDVDLGLWVPSFGFTEVPISGRLSGDATIVGRYPSIALRANAAIDAGTLGPLPLDVAKVSLHSAGASIIVDNAQLATTGLRATASGSLGIGRALPLNLHVAATSDDIAPLIYQVAHVNVPLSGSFESTLNVGGTFKA